MDNEVSLQITAAMLASMTLSIKIDNMDDAQLSLYWLLGDALRSGVPLATALCQYHWGKTLDLGKESVIVSGAGYNN